MNNLISEDYLMHHGIKGMKWGVRRNQDIQKLAKSKANSIKSYKLSDKKKQNIKNGAKIAGKVLIAAGIVSAAAIIGLEAYKYGQMNADLILNKGTQIQSIAPSEKTDFSKTFYAAVGKDDKRKILKSFSLDTSRRAKELGLSGQVRANIFENTETEKIAGLKNMRKAYKTINNGSSIGFNRFIMSYGAKQEAQRQPFMNELNKRGYSGFRDIDGMAKWWGGKTPIILNGGRTTFKLTKNPIIYLDRLSKVPVNNIEGHLQTATDISYKVLPAAALSATTVYAAQYVEDKKKETKEKNKEKSA